MGRQTFSPALFLIILKNMSEEKKNTGAANPALDDKLMKTRSVMLTGEITKESADQVVRQLLVLDSESDEPITVYINSPGGDVDAGFAIYDMVRFISAPVTMVGIGLVASAASLVLLAVPAERRVGFANSSYLIHQPLSKMKGVAADVLIHASVIERLRAKLDGIIAEATGKSVDEVSADTERDHWLFADEALSYGLISRIVKSKSEL